VSARRIVVLAILLAAIAAPLFAEVQVTLKSGASLVGKVSTDGKDVVVKIEDSELRVPLAEVEAITSVEAGGERQARRLLMTALEARVNNDDGGMEVIGLLAEAARLAPDDPHIAYWYASTLADSGYGQAANDVLTRKREAIAAAYPGLTEQLTERIKRRVATEMLPPALVARLDQLNATLSKPPANAEMVQTAAMFRLVDQHKQPLERTAFQIYSNNVQDENVESFDDGYYLYVYNRHRSNPQQPTKIDIIRPGYEAKSFDISGSTTSVRDAGELAAKRFEEGDKVKFRVNVVDRERKPIVGARMTLMAYSPRGGNSEQPATTESDAEGWAEVLVFPMAYNYSIEADGFNGTGGRVELKPGAGEKHERFQQMSRAIQATIRAAWEATSMQGGGKTSGESTISVGTGVDPNQYAPNPTSWLRPVQKGDQLTLQFMDQFFGYNNQFGQPPEAWVRVVDDNGEAKLGSATDAPATDSTAEVKPADAAVRESAKGDAEKDKAKQSPLKTYNALKLEEIDDLKAKLPQPRMLPGGERTGPNPPLLLAAKAGGIYVGRLQHRDVRTGQPVQLAFKVFVEEIDDGNGKDE
jgi:hypothetical protein